MLSFDEFTRSPLCRPLVLSEEDTPQDRTEGLRLLKKDRERQYDAYVSQSEPKPIVEKQLDMVRTLDNSGAQPKRDRTAYFREYRKRKRKCKYCGKEQ